MANTIAAALICSMEAILPNSEAKVNGFKANHDESDESHVDDEKESGNLDCSSMIVSLPSLSTSSSNHHNCWGSASVLRYEIMLLASK